MATVYSVNFATGKYARMAQEGKDNLEVGRVLQLWGYDRPEAVITGKTEGMGRKTLYQVIWLTDKRFGSLYAYELAFATERKDDRIQTYITDKIIPMADVDVLVAEAKAHAEAAQKIFDEKTKKDTDDAARGRALFADLIPPDVKALIVAEKDVDDSDMQSDYFGHVVKETVVIGWSTSDRDSFKEMRKAAAGFPETAHLATGPAEFEHREKWSMGAGYYLKDGHSHSTGWNIHKVKKYDRDWPDYIYQAMGKRCIFKEVKPCGK